MKHFIFILFLSISVLSHAQTRLSGIVVDKNNEGLPGANVIIKASGLGTLTDKYGKFELQNLIPGLYRVEVSFIGYATQSQLVDVNETSVSVNFSLQPGTVQLSEVIVGSSADRGINTISKLDIAMRPVNTSQDMLRIVPGLFIAQHAGGGKAEQIFLRGFDIDHGTDINLEVDGLPVNMVSHAHGQGYSDLHFIIPELVQYVDFEKGPYYADKGDFTTAGFVSFHTKYKLDRNFFKAEGGQFGSARLVTGVNLLNREKSNAYVASEYFRSDGYFESPQNFNRVNITGKYNLKINEQDNIQANVSHFSSRWDASGQIPERAVNSKFITRFGTIDDTEGGYTSRTNASLKHQHQFSSTSALETQAFVSRYNFNLYSNFTFFLHDSERGDQIQQKENRRIYGAKTAYYQTTSFANSTLVTEAGIGFRLDEVNDIQLSKTLKRTFLSHTSKGDVREANMNAFICETFSWNNWTLNGSIRFDNFYFNSNDHLAESINSVSKSIASPKLNLSYQVNSKTELFVKSGIGFHSNDARVVVQQPDQTILPKAYGVDIGATSKISKNLLLRVALWRLDLDQEFVYVGDEGIVEPNGKTKRQGIDFTIRYQALSWLYLDTDLSLTQPRNKGEETFKYIPLAPTVSSVGGIAVQLKKGWSGSLRYRYLSDRAANDDRSVLAKGYLLADGVLNYAHKNLLVGFAIENIFNRPWKEAQFETESRLQHETESVSEIHYTPGTPLSAKLSVTIFF